MSRMVLFRVLGVFLAGTLVAPAPALAAPIADHGGGNGGSGGTSGSGGGGFGSVGPAIAPAPSSTGGGFGSVGPAIAPAPSSTGGSDFGIKGPALAPTDGGSANNEIPVAGVSDSDAVPSPATDHTDRIPPAANKPGEDVPPPAVTGPADHALPPLDKPGDNQPSTSTPAHKIIGGSGDAPGRPNDHGPAFVPNDTDYHNHNWPYHWHWDDLGWDPAYPFDWIDSAYWNFWYPTWAVQCQWRCPANDEGPYPADVQDYLNAHPDLAAEFEKIHQLPWEQRPSAIQPFLSTHLDYKKWFENRQPWI
ncbi:Uncharacterised protein [Mycobacteroides abscessus subsp. abscessus]|nr:Uncharacterised protein [Mycobacteroides abscessus subsp. abscessus]